MWYIVLAAFLGALAVGFLGFLESNYLWDWRRFAATVIRGVIAAAGVAYLMADTPLTDKVYLAAFITGSGGEALLKRGTGALENKIVRTWGKK